MSKMMIYASLSATGGNIENVYGHKMRVRTIDASDKDEVEQAKADGWLSKADDVIEQIEAQEQVETANEGNKKTLKLEMQNLNIVCLGISQNVNKFCKLQ